MLCKQIVLSLKHLKFCSVVWAYFYYNIFTVYIIFVEQLTVPLGFTGKQV